MACRLVICLKTPLNIFALNNAVKINFSHMMIGFKVFRYHKQNSGLDVCVMCKNPPQTKTIKVADLQ